MIHMILKLQLLTASLTTPGLSDAISNVNLQGNNAMETDPPAPNSKLTKEEEDKYLAYEELDLLFLEQDWDPAKEKPRDED